MSNNKFQNACQKIRKLRIVNKPLVLDTIETDSFPKFSYKQKLCLNYLAKTEN